MRGRRIILLILLPVVLSSVAFAQAPRIQRPLAPPPPPPPARPGDPFPLVFPGSRVTREVDLSGGNLQRMLSQDPSLKEVTRIRIIHMDIPRPPGEPAVPPEVVSYYDQQLVSRGWKRMWHNEGMGRPRMVYTGPEGRGFFSLMTLPRGAVVTYIEGLGNIQKMPDVERLIRSAVQGKQDTPREIRKAEQYHRSGQTDKAVEIYKRLIEDDPLVPGPYFGLALIRFEQGRASEAESNFRRALELDPLNAAVRGHYARFLVSVKNWRDAEYEARQSIALAPELPMARMVLADVLENKGDTKGALEEYKLLLQRPTGRAEFYIRLGMLQEKMGLNNEAVESFENALKLDPDNNQAKEALERLRK